MTRSVHSVYLSVKAFGCCSVLNVVGWLWLGIIVCVGAALLLCVTAVSALCTLDGLPGKGCCECFGPADFVDEAADWGAPPCSPAGSTDSKAAAATTTTKHQQLAAAGRRGSGGIPASR